MNIRPLIILCQCVIVSSCAIFNPGAPKDFVIKQDTGPTRAILDESSTGDYTVAFVSGKSELSAKEADKLDAWLDTTAPIMIAVRGTGGAEEYRELGNNRALSIITHIQSKKKNVDMVMLDYDASYAGGRALVDIVSSELSTQIIKRAPILVIKSE